MTKVGIVVGSLRKNAFSKRWAQNIETFLPNDYEVEYLEIGNLPLYSEDYDGNEPQVYLDFRETVERQDAIIFVTPEYNRSVPGVLKNAIDVGSRPYGQNKWNGKPALVASHSISGISGFGANHHLRQSLVFLNMPVLQQPEIYLPQSQNLLDEEGNITQDSTTQFLQSAVDAFVDFAAKINS